MPSDVNLDGARVEDNPDELPLEARGHGKVNVERNDADRHQSSFSTLLGEACLDIKEDGWNGAAGFDELQEEVRSRRDFEYNGNR